MRLMVVLFAPLLATISLLGWVLPSQTEPTAPPETTIDSGPSGHVGSGSASFFFSSSVSGSTFQCSLDGETSGDCVSPKEYAAITDGSHTFSVRATDSMGNTDPSPASRTWTVDTRAPAIDVTTPLEGSTYVLDQTVNAAYGCTDGTGESGLKSCVGTVSDGSPIDTATIGSKTFTVNAEDNTGNTTSLTRGYRVVEGDPTLVGAGDIAKCGKTGDDATAALLDGLEGTVFTLGDNVYQSGTSTEFANCYEPSWGRHKARSRPAVGNHEYVTPGASGYFDYFGAAAGDPGKGYYSYDLGAWHVAVLNSNCSEVGGCDAGSQQERWLEDDLAAHPNECTIAYWHHARFTSGAHGDNLGVAPLWNELYRAGADVVLSGHDHDYERFAPQDRTGQPDPAQGIREFVVGTGGAEFTQFKTANKANSEVRVANTNGVLKLDLHQGGYDWAFVTAPDGTRVDSGSGTCHGKPADPTAPTVQAPQQAMLANATLGTTFPAKISWSATDEGSGVARYELQQSTDGGLFKNVALKTAATTSATRQLSAGHDYRFRVRATDGAGNTSDWEEGQQVSVRAEQEGSTAISYEGAWSDESAPSAYEGASRYASAKGESASLGLAGATSVGWVASKGPDRGKAQVWVDGVKAKTVDLYSSTEQPKRMVFTANGLDPSVDHAVEIRVLGTKNAASSGTRVDVDAFVVLK